MNTAGKSVTYFVTRPRAAIYRADALCPLSPHTSIVLNTHILDGDSYNGLHCAATTVFCTSSLRGCCCKPTPPTAANEVTSIVGSAQRFRTWKVNGIDCRWLVIATNLDQLLLLLLLLRLQMTL